MLICSSWADEELKEPENVNTYNSRIPNFRVSLFARFMTDDMQVLGSRGGVGQ